MPKITERLKTCQREVDVIEIYHNGQHCMILTRHEVSQLLPHLQDFAGSLEEPGEDEMKAFPAGSKVRVKVGTKIMHDFTRCKIDEAEEQIVFTVGKVNGCWLQLTAPGYGAKDNYGSGHIAVALGEAQECLVKLEEPEKVPDKPKCATCGDTGIIWPREVYNGPKPCPDCGSVEERTTTEDTFGGKRRSLPERNRVCVNDLENRIGVLLEYIEQLKGRIGRWDNWGEEVDRDRDRLDDLEKRIEDDGRRVTVLQAAVNGLYSKNDSNEQRRRSIQCQLDSFKNAIATLQGNDATLAVLVHDVTSMETSIAKLQNKPTTVAAKPTEKQ